MPELTVGELRALRNLAVRQDDVVSPFLNIADARRLTDLGFAVRSRQGWDITPAGAAYLHRRDAAGPTNII
jgi:hypothetical protein